MSQTAYHIGRMTQQRPLILRSLACQILAWCLFLLLAGGALAGWRYQSLVSALENESGILHRLASQRVDQHDAHLTALSAVANTTGDTQHALFLDVASTIARFYPRIDDIQLVPLDASEGSEGIGPLLPALAQQVREATIKSDGLKLQERLAESGVGWPTIVISGHGDIEACRRAFRNGAVDFLSHR